MLVGNDLIDLVPKQLDVLCDESSLDLFVFDNFLIMK